MRTSGGRRHSAPIGEDTPDEAGYEVAVGERAINESQQRRQARTVWRVGSVVLIVVVVVALFAVTDQPSADLEIRDPGDVYDPSLAGEPLPDGYRPLHGRDMIHPVYDPVFAAAGEVDWPDNTDVIGVAGVEEAKAYPVSYLNFREMVIDDIEGIPILVSWCPLCGTAMVHRRELDGEPLVLGNQGALWGNAMTWWDHDTGSIWSQPLGEAIAGPHKGQRLELYPVTLTKWDAWLDSHPQTLALDVPGRSTNFDLEQMAIVVDLGTDSAAYVVRPLREVGVINDTVADVDIAVVIDPADDQRWAVFSRQLDSSVAELQLTDEGLVDTNSGTVFDPFLGLGLSGPLAEQSLGRLPGFTSFRSDYLTFFPEGRIWRG